VFFALQLLYFRLVSVLFPTSDRRHPVITPVMLFMSHILTQVRSSTGQTLPHDIAFIWGVCVLYTLHAAITYT